MTNLNNLFNVNEIVTSSSDTFFHPENLFTSLAVACVAGGIVGARNNVSRPPAISDSAARTLFRASAIPPARQATLAKRVVLGRRRRLSFLSP